MINKLKLIVFGIFRGMFFLGKVNRWSVLVAEKMATLFGEVSINGRKVFLSTVNPILLYRLQTFYSKEPETIEWLDHLDEKDVLYDIGANVGLYSIYAGVKGANVLAFEPVFYNFSIINSNIARNSLEKKITAYPIALSSKMEFGKMHLTNLTPGGAYSSFSSDNSNGVVEQGSISFCMDDLIENFNFPVPTHVKIDVDGLEAKIVKGMEKTLENSKLRSVLIEINEDLDSDCNIVKDLKEIGFTVSVQGLYPESGTKIRNYIFNR